MYFRIVDGEITRGDKIKFMANGVEREVGYLVCGAWESCCVLSVTPAQSFLYHRYLEHACSSLLEPQRWRQRYLKRWAHVTDGGELGNSCLCEPFSLQLAPSPSACLVAKVIEVGVRKPGAFEMERLGTGEVGYLVCGVKNVLDARVGDTITNAKERERTGEDEGVGFSPDCEVFFFVLFLFFVTMIYCTESFQAADEKQKPAGVEDVDRSPSFLTRRLS